MRHRWLIERLSLLGFLLVGIAIQCTNAQEPDRATYDVFPVGESTPAADAVRHVLLPDSSGRASSSMGSPLGQQQSTKRALLIGIDEYASPKVPDLRGAVNDVEKMRQLLISKFEFPEEQVLVLTNEQATHDGIIRAIQDHLIAPSGEDDVVVMHYSGHGSRMVDGADDDETDGWDETLVPHDSRQANVFDISDDQIRGLLDQLVQRTSHITFVFDSCHSGTGSRASGMPRRVAPDRRTPPPMPAYARSARGTEEGLWRPGDRFVLLSAARSDQYAFEYSTGERHYGAFTYFLTDELERAGAGVTYRDVMDLVSGSVRARYERQSPQIEGAGEDSYVFSDSADVAQPYVLVAPERDGGVTLQAGAVHGVTKGSTYAVYPPGTKHFEEVAPTAHVEVTAVDGLTSTAAITDSGTVRPHARAVETEHAFPDQHVRVHFMEEESSQVLGAVRDALDGRSHIVEHPEASGYTLLLRETDEHIVIEAPDTTHLNEISIAPSINPSVVDTVVARVEDWARWYNLLEIANPSPHINIAVYPSAREVVAPQGFTLTVGNTSSRQLFITILDISTDGSVSQVFPHPRQAGAEALPAGQIKTITFPETFVPGARTAVNDYLKVFATTSEVDLRSLTQDPIVSRSQGQSITDPWARLLNQAASGISRGTGAGVQLDDWTTARTMIVVKRE